MRLTLLLVCFWPFFLFSNESLKGNETAEVSATEGLPSNIANHSVCVISGEYVDSIVDVMLPGPEPLVISRHYASFSTGDKPGWFSNHADTLILSSGMYEEKFPVYVVSLRQPSFAQFDYFHAKTKEAQKKRS